MSELHALSTKGQTLRLPDGRTLGYAEYGRSAGEALFYFHGHPGSRSEARFLAEPAAQAGLRLIGVDRPGMGLSSYKAGRQLLDWPDDVRALANALHLDRFSVVGFSGGGPYALACAYRLPHRLKACGMVAGVGHTGRLLSFLSMWLPWLILPVMRRSFRTEAQAQKALRQAARNWVEPDRSVVSIPGVSDIMAASLVEALEQGARGAAYDGVLLGRPWGFKLEDVAFPALYLWHGELDNQVPLVQGRAVAGRLAHCQAVYYPGEGHISLMATRARDIVTAIAES